jgi:hypothetical protein
LTDGPLESADGVVLVAPWPVSNAFFALTPPSRLANPNGKPNSISPSVENANAQRLRTTANVNFDRRPRRDFVANKGRSGVP